MKTFCHLSRFAWGRFFYAAMMVLVLLGPATSTLNAQFKFRQPPNRQDPSALGKRDQAFVWNQFVGNRNLGPFTLAGSLVYRPASEPSRSYQFTLKADWNQQRQSSSLELVHPDGTVTETGVVISGSKAYRALPDGSLQPLAPERLVEPIVAGLPFTWNDLLMPYLTWQDVEYEGPDRYLGRPAHRYALSNPDPEGFPARVVVTLDEDYAALLRGSLYDADGEVVKRIRVGGFRQYGDEWMFSSLYWEDRASRSSVRLSVDSFRYGL